MLRKGSVPLAPESAIRQNPGLRSVLELPFSFALRRLIMGIEAQREKALVEKLAEEASLRTLVPRSLEPTLGPSSSVNTFYILGSGESVEDISRVYWSQIRAQRSVGINNWGLHPFVPDAYSLESVPQIGDGKDFRRALTFLNREEVRRRKPKILILRPRTLEDLKDVSLLSAELERNVSFYGRVSPATRRLRNLATDLRSYFSTVAPRNQSILLDSGASVVRMVSLGIVLGFRRIVLVGVDLNGSQYFWEKNSNYLLGLSGPPPVNNQRLAMHETTSRDNRPFDVITMLKALQHFLRVECGGELYVASSKSALAEFLPLDDGAGSAS